MPDIPGVLNNARRNKRGVLEVEYGEYPQYAPGFDIQRTLADEFSKGTLRKTGKTYTTDSRRYDDFSRRFNPTTHEEFEYNGKRYVRVKSDWCEDGYKLSNGATVHPGEYYWVEVSPITWLVDEEAKLLISKTSLASGIRFCDYKQYRGDFKATDMYMFLNEYFAEDIIPSAIYELSPEGSIKNLERLREELRQMGNTPQQRTPEILDELEEIQEESQDINLSELDCTIVGKDRFLRGFDDRTEYTLGLLRIVQKALGVPEVPVSSPSNGTGVKDLPVYEEPLYTLRQKLMDEGQALDKEIGDSLCEIHLISDKITDKIHRIR